MNINRRKLIQIAGLSGLGLSIYSGQRGIRLPSLHWDPAHPNSNFEIKALSAVNGTGLIQTSTRDYLDASFRAFQPEPSLILMSPQSQRIIISVGNIARDAELGAQDGSMLVHEKIDRITRTLTIDLVANRELNLVWRLPSLNTFKFASIGDTGGDQELAWCLQRAQQLGARFLLHLGDFNYQDGDYARSIRLFNDSEIPVYVSIGNHDFHDTRAIYPTFLKEIGPLNSVFSIGKTRFANIDTAANVLPYGAGQRGKLFEQLIEQNNFTDTVAFTHRPLHDPVEGYSHDIGSTGERDWLIDKLKKADIRTLISGHIHIYDRSNFAGIENIIAGQGLGHQDLLVNDDHSKMIIGQVDTNGSVSYSAQPLAMPMNMHCHPRSTPAKQSSLHVELIEQVSKACKESS